MKKFLFAISILAAYSHLHAQSWSLTGNSGTTPGTNFLGTKDSKALMFKTNNQQSGYLDYDATKANTSFGYRAGKNNKGTENSSFGYKAFFSNSSGAYNVAAGTYALYSNTTGQYNTAVGDQALYINQIGWENTAVGKGALFSNTGFYNTATGYASLISNGDGNYNTAHGISALYSNTTGSYNTSLGADAMYYNNSGVCNTAAGSYTLFKNTGNYNTGVGFYALEATTGAYYNTAIGYEAGDSYDNGYNNVFCGANTDVNGTGYYNVIAMGQGTICTAVSQARFGNSATNSIGGWANWTNISDGRVKRNIQQNVPGLAFIKKLQPVTYNLDLDAADRLIQAPQRKDSTGKIIAKTAIELAARKAKEQIVYTGFVAQDVEKAAKELDFNFSGVDAAKNSKDLYGLRYAEFVVPIVKAVQELSAQNESLKAKNDELEARLTKVEALLTTNLKETGSSEGFLKQNVPNPAVSATTIGYYAPSIGQIRISDIKGGLIKSYSVSKGEGQLNITGGELATGVYTYTLFVNGKAIETKKMIVNR